MAALATRSSTRLALGSSRAALPVLARPSVRRCSRVSRPAYGDGPSGFDKSSSFDNQEVNKKLNDTVTNAGAFIKQKWEETEDKPAAVVVTLGAILGLSALSGVVNAVDRIPIVSDVIELIGVGVTGWFTYRYLVFGPDREELVQKVQDFLKKVYGK